MLHEYQILCSLFHRMRVIGTPRGAVAIACLCIEAALERLGDLLVKLNIWKHVPQLLTNAYRFLSQ